MMNKKILTVMIILFSFMLLTGCAETSITPVLPSMTAHPTLKFTPSPSPTDTMTPTADLISAWLTRRPRDMESYGFVYDPNAIPELPPAESISFPIWRNNLPLEAFDRQPEFINTRKPEPAADWNALLDQAGCHWEQNQAIECSPESPLTGYGCVWIYPPRNEFPGLGPDIHVLATCSLQPDDPEEPPSAHLYRGGCAFRINIAFILEQDGNYSILKTPEELKSLLVPIDTPEKALTYAEMMTGLDAVYQFEPDPDLLYFQDQVEGTQVKEENGGYTINLFHFQHCFCEPWINSIVIVTVDHAGSLTWQSASPWSMTLGFGCAD